MDVVMLARVQFAVTVFFHFVFVPLTLGLSILIAYMETLYVRTGNEEYKRMAQFWGKLFLINFALGVVTGITLEFQFGTNWSQYSVYMGDIFGSLLAFEATMAFFLESTFLAVWFFGWERLSKGMHLFAIYAVAFASNLSAVWIILANGFMQNPVGFEIIDGRAIMTDFLAVVTNGFAWSQFFHTIFAAWLLAGFFVLGVSVWHIARKNETQFFRRSFSMAAKFSLVLAVLLIAQGHHHGTVVARDQPAKLAAMEAHWETSENAPIYLLTLPDEKNQRNYFEWLPVPGALSFLAHGNFSSEVIGLKDAAAADFDYFVEKTGYDPTKPVVTMADGTEIHRPLDRETAMPPVLISFLSFRVMVGMAFVFLAIAGISYYYRNDPAKNPLYAKYMPWVIPVPYIIIMIGWTLAEVGRQPWIVYRLQATVQAVSPVPASSVATSLVAFIAVYSVLGAVAIYLVHKFARLGPKPLAK